MERNAPGKPVYEPPRVLTYYEASLVELVGPAVACAWWDGGSGEDDEQGGREHEN